jgi:hypothetical protein
MYSVVVFITGMVVAANARTAVSTSRLALRLVPQAASAASKFCNLSCIGTLLLHVELQVTASHGGAS